MASVPVFRSARSQAPRLRVITAEIRSSREFLGDSVEGMDICRRRHDFSRLHSGIAREMKSRGARNIYCAVTFALFTEGIDHFSKAYDEGLFSKVFATNLIYRRPELLASPWFVDVNLTKFVALLIDAINHDASLSNLINPTDKIRTLLEKRNDPQL